MIQLMALPWPFFDQLISSLSNSYSVAGIVGFASYSALLFSVYQSYKGKIDSAKNIPKKREYQRISKWLRRSSGVSVPSSPSYAIAAMGIKPVIFNSLTLLLVITATTLVVPCLKK